MNQYKNRIYVRQANSGGSVVGRILGIIMLLATVGFSIAFGLIVLAVGFVLLIPVMWKQRHAIKQMWQMRKQAKQQFEQQRQAQQEAERHYSERNSEGSVIDGEYKDLSDKNDKS